MPATSLVPAAVKQVKTCLCVRIVFFIFTVPWSQHPIQVRAWKPSETGLEDWNRNVLVNKCLLVEGKQAGQCIHSSRTVATLIWKEQSLLFWNLP